MSKILSLFIILIGMIFSWRFFNTTPSIDTQTHAAIQSQLAILIEDTVKNKKPLSSDFKIERLVTSTINENMVSAQFSYQFNDIVDNTDTNKRETVTQSISGSALLAKTPSENNGLQKWVIQTIKTSKEAVVFNEGLVISSGSDENIVK